MSDTPRRTGSKERATPRPERPPRGRVAFRWAVAAAWTAVVVVLSLLPGDALRGPEITGFGLAAHFVVYAVMSLAIHNALGRASVKRGLAVTAACAATGVALELAQIPVPGRAAEVWDAILNAAGAAAASVVYVRFKRDG